MAAPTHTHRYPRASGFRSDTGLDLATTPGHVLHGDDAAPRFFDGVVTRPDVFAAGLRAVATVAASRWTPTADEIRFRDPVVTSNGDRLRFEAFSACASVYARLDVLGGCLDGELLDRGTTNIDVNEPLRRLLTRVAADEPLHLTVGSDELAVTTTTGSAVERKVPLPIRWLKGFSEVHVVAAAWEPRLDLAPTEAARFLRGLPRGSAGGWVVPAGRGARLTGRPVVGAVALADTDRLGPALPLLRWARSVRAFGPTPGERSSGAPSGWEFDLDGLRLTLLLSQRAVRGWSGEGAALDSLQAGVDAAAVDLLAAALVFDARLDLDDLAVRTGLDRPVVRGAVDVLGSSGRVGFDLAEAAWFHRELPFDAAAVAALNPRLHTAAGLVDAGAVTPFDATSWDVRSGDTVYRVRRDAVSWTCTCIWWIRHRGDRGPCKHVLAVRAVEAAGEGTTVAVGDVRAARP